MTDTSDNNDSKSPTETLRDEEKAAAGEVVPPAEAEVPGAQKPDNEEIRDEKGPNTE